MIISILIAAICLIAVLQPTDNRSEIAILYALSLAIQDAVFGDASGDIYFFTDAAAGSIVLAAICVYSKPSRFTDNMVILIVASILINCYGYIAYELYWPATGYEAAFHTIYLIAVFILTRAEADETRDSHIFWLPYYKIGDCSMYLHREERP